MIFQFVTFLILTAFVTSDTIRYSSDNDNLVINNIHFAHRLKLLSDDLSRAGDTGKYFSMRAVNVIETEFLKGAE